MSVSRSVCSGSAVSVSQELGPLLSSHNLAHQLAHRYSLSLTSTVAASQNRGSHSHGNYSFSLICTVSVSQEPGPFLSSHNLAYRPVHLRSHTCSLCLVHSKIVHLMFGHFKSTEMARHGYLAVSSHWHGAWAEPWAGTLNPGVIRVFLLQPRPQDPFTHWPPWAP